MPIAFLGQGDQNYAFVPFLLVNLGAGAKDHLKRLQSSPVAGSGWGIERCGGSYRALYMSTQPRTLAVPP